MAPAIDDPSTYDAPVRRQYPRSFQINDNLNTGRPTTADIEAVLVAMLAAAQEAGESFLDVSAKTLCKTVMGDTSSSQGMAACCRLMHRMMIPGDHELSDSRSGNTPKLLIRFRVPR